MDPRLDAVSSWDPQLDMAYRIGPARAPTRYGASSWDPQLDTRIELRSLGHQLDTPYRVETC